MVLQQLDVQISLGRPRRTSDVAQPCGDANAVADQSLGIGAFKMGLDWPLYVT